MPRLLPTQVGPYELLIPLGTGGMATVHLARVPTATTHRLVALKLLHPHLKEQPEQVEQILHEARIAALVRHPNVVQVFDVGEDPAGAYLVMHYIEGEVLSELMRTVEQKKERIPRRVAVKIILDVLAGLHAAHEVVDEQGRVLDLVHRDVSPQNILVGVDGVTRLTDFGIAKVATRRGMTRAGVVKGKASYMSPEQARARPIDRRSDVFAAAVVAWELFAGRSMHPPGKEMAVMARITSEDAPRLSTVAPGIDKDLEDAVAAALARDPAARTPSAMALASAILEAASGEVATAREVAAYVTTTAADAIKKRHAQMLAAVGDETTTPLISLRELRAAKPGGARREGESRRRDAPAVDYDTTPSPRRFASRSGSMPPAPPSSSPASMPPPPRASMASIPAVAGPLPILSVTARSSKAARPKAKGPGSPTVTRVIVIVSLLLAATTVGLFRLLLGR